MVSKSQGKGRKGTRDIVAGGLFLQDTGEEAWGRQHVGSLQSDRG